MRRLCGGGVGGIMLMLPGLCFAKGLTVTREKTVEPIKENPIQYDAFSIYVCS